MSQILKKFLYLSANCKTPKIAVYGDAMIDEYYKVRVKKISPEFPIPVMHSEKEEKESLPGGAANVVCQFENFNVESFLISFIDFPALDVFNSKKINSYFCKLLSKDVAGRDTLEYSIPRKRRFYSDDFPTYRWDVEKKNYGLEKHELEQACLELQKNLENGTQKFDVVVFSDYDKGVLEYHIPEYLYKQKITIVDPKSGDLDRWKYCTVFKPNAAEALALSGCNTIDNAGHTLLSELKCEAVVITQAADGVSVFYKENGETVIHRIKPKSKLEAAVSVIGAGDCFVAFMAMSLAYGMTILEATEVAWQAGTLYVKNKHNKPLSQQDIAKACDSSIIKFVKPEDLSERDFKLVFTNGCFDILHAGHLESLKFAKSQGDKLVVAVNTDDSVAENKPGRPFVNLKDRMSLLAGLECVDFVVSFSEKTPLEILQKIKPDVLVKGAEYHKESVVGNDIVAEVVLAPMFKGLSTTNLVEKIRNSINNTLV